jgi:hypothetical protein
VNCNDTIRLDDEHDVGPTGRMTYLGSTISPDGRMSSEITRRIGIARADFRAVRQVWSHASLSRRRKLEIFTALIEAKLLYALSTGCFTKAELRRLDGFQARCLRIILKISPAYYSRISNEVVRQSAGFECASTKLSKRQLLLLGKIMRSPEGEPRRSSSFIPGTILAATERYVRRVGRPQKEWIPTALAEAYKVGGSDLQTLTSNERMWKRLVLSR